MMYFYKKHKKDKMWWVYDPSVRCPKFSFDKETVFYLFRDYPKNLTPEQKEIFDKENPYWAEGLKNRTTSD